MIIRGQVGHHRKGAEARQQGSDGASMPAQEAPKAPDETLHILVMGGKGPCGSLFHTPIRGGSPQDAALAVSVDLAGAESVLVSGPDAGLDAEVDLRESVA